MSDGYAFTHPGPRSGLLTSFTTAQSNCILQDAGRKALAGTEECSTRVFP